MITIYEFSTINAYWTGAFREIPDGSGIPMFWTDDPLPSIPEGMFARWNNSGWVVTSDPAPVPPPPEEPVAETVAEPAAQTAPTVI